MKKTFLFVLTVIAIIIMTLPIHAFAQNPVAEVNGTSYDNIADAVNVWRTTNNSTLTLKADVTLSAVITLKSTENHTLNLGTYTMTAASGQHAIEITCEGRSSASYCLTVNADQSNPGGITANGKSCIYYKKTGSTKDRPIITVNGGIFNGSYSLNFTSNGNTNCPDIRIYGGIFNANVNLTKCKLITNGGYFNCSVYCNGDQNAYRLFTAGTFKSFQFLTYDNQETKNKLAYATSKATNLSAQAYDVGVYVNDDGYLVVGGSVVQEAGTTFQAKAGYSRWHASLKYSSANANDLYYTSVAKALGKNTSSNNVVTVYPDNFGGLLDMTGSSFTGTINLSSATDRLTVTFAEGTTPKWNVSTDLLNKVAVYTETVADGVVTREYCIKTAYTVHYYLQNVAQDGYVLDSTVILGGDIGQDTEAAINEYTGFAVQAFTQGVVAEDGSTVVDIYYTRIMYTVTYTADGVVVDTQQVPYQGSGAAPEIPAKVGYDQTVPTWNLDGTNITADTEIQAVYTINTYTVTFVVDGEVLDMQTVEHGGDATQPTIPEKAGFNDTAPVWNLPCTGITTDVEIHAVYTQNLPGEFIDITPSTNVGEGKLTEEIESVKDKVPLTGTEELEIQQGSDAHIWLEVTDISEVVPDHDKKKISETVGNDGAFLYLDIAMYKRIGSGEVIVLPELKDKVEIRIKLADELINSDADIIRTYHIVYIHDGETEIITPTYNAEEKILTFSANQFSTYAVAYSDEMTVTNVDTGDSFNLGLAVFGLMAAATCYGLKKKRTI